MADLYSQYLEYYSATLRPQTVKLEFLVINVQKIRIKGPLYLEQDYVTHRSNTEWKETCGLSGHFHLVQTFTFYANLCRVGEYDKTFSKNV